MAGGIPGHEPNQGADKEASCERHEKHSPGGSAGGRSEDVSTGTPKEPLAEGYELSYRNGAQTGHHAHQGRQKEDSQVWAAGEVQHTPAGPIHIPAGTNPAFQESPVSPHQSPGFGVNWYQPSEEGSEEER